MKTEHKPLVWLAKTIKTPPMSEAARIESGYLLRVIQSGINIGMPQSRPMPSIGERCHELRINDETKTWRIFYRIDHDAIVIADWTDKKTEQTPKRQIDLCRSRLKNYDESSEV